MVMTTLTNLKKQKRSAFSDTQNPPSQPGASFRLFLSSQEKKTHFSFIFFSKFSLITWFVQEFTTSVVGFFSFCGLELKLVAGVFVIFLSSQKKKAHFSFILFFANFSLITWFVQEFMNWVVGFFFFYGLEFKLVAGVVVICVSSQEKKKNLLLIHLVLFQFFIENMVCARIHELGSWVFLFLWIGGVASCRSGCDLSFGSYYVDLGNNLSFISTLFGKSIPEILQVNPSIKNKDSITTGVRINIPFSCDCINGEFLAHNFVYDFQHGDTYLKVATNFYANLTSVDWLQRVNIYEATWIPDNVPINVTVNCSCGVPAISRNYGLFLTYPLRDDENLLTVASKFNFSPTLLQQYRQASNSSLGDKLLFIPVEDTNGSYHPLKSSSSGFGVGAKAGISSAVVVVAALFVTVFLYVRASRRKKMKATPLLPSSLEDNCIQNAHGSLIPFEKATESVAVPSAFTGITVDKSVEFSYEELAKATDDFSMANKIGEGGFGAVYYAEIRGEKAAIKKMDMQASREFLAELKVLTHVHHLNLVRLIGFCIEGSLFLVYEFIENGNLSQHLREPGREPVSWTARVQIALDSARGLEYIHEHTVPVYIHRDIKSANILIDKNFRGKVADFGLAKLTEVGSSSLPTRLVGTFGYMPPEYAQYGDVSPKVDVYAFGVVLYELISAKEAIVKAYGSVAESKGLVSLFESVLSQTDPQEGLLEILDPRLGGNYPLESVLKMAHLARACTQENPQLRPSMRSIVVALMTLSSSTEDWDVGSFYENQALVNLMSGR